MAFHISDDQRVRRCDASTPNRCPYGTHSETRAALEARLEARAKVAEQQIVVHLNNQVEPAVTVATRRTMNLVYGFGPEHCPGGPATIFAQDKWAGTLVDYFADNGYQHKHEDTALDDLEPGCYFTRFDQERELVLTHVFTDPTFGTREYVQFRLFTNPPKFSNFGVTRNPQEFTDALTAYPNWGLHAGSLSLHDPQLGPMPADRMDVNELQETIFKLYDGYSAQEVAEWVGVSRIDPDPVTDDGWEAIRLVPHRQEQPVIGATIDRLVADDPTLTTNQARFFTTGGDSQADRTPARLVLNRLASCFGVDVRNADWYDGTPGQYPHGVDPARGELVLSFPMDNHGVKVLRVPLPEGAWVHDHATV